MKLPMFDMNAAYWDMYRTFYIPHGPGRHHPGTGSFIQLHTGELMILNRTWEPDQRTHYRDLNIQIASTKDDDCPRFCRPGDKKLIPKSHLNFTGQQIMLIDWNHQIAVCIERPNRGKAEPSNLGLTERWENEDFVAWYKGEKSAPVGQPTIVEYEYPFSTEQKEHIQTIREACQTWYKMQDNQLNDSEVRRIRRENPPVSMLGLTQFNFEELTDGKRQVIALQDLDRGTEIEVLDYVVIAKKTT